MFWTSTHGDIGKIIPVIYTPRWKAIVSPRNIIFRASYTTVVVSRDT